ncbi:MAG: ABC transporter ATP-binding protein [bacterium]
MTRLAARGLGKRYGEAEALRGLDLELEPGTLTGLVGPDGAGKTTTMRLLTGLLMPDEGEVLLGGEDVTGRRARGGRIGYMPQRFSLYPDLSVSENLRFYAGLFGVRGSERRERTAGLLRFARLEEFTRRRAAALSGGMKQKLALACTLIHAPEVLLLDEPTTGVDPVSRVEFWDILHTLREEGTALLVSTPYMDEADRCSRVIVLREGRVLDRGTPEELRDRFPHAVLEAEVRPMQKALGLLDATEWVRDAVPFGGRIHVTVERGESSPERIRRMLSEGGVEAERVRRVDPGMEDVFIALSGRGREEGGG